MTIIPLARKTMFSLLFLTFSLISFQGVCPIQASQGKPASFQLKQDDSGPPSSNKDLRGSVEEMLFEKTNEMRGRSKLPSLGSNSILIKAARYHSDDMYRKNYLSHFSPDGKSPLDRIRKFKPGYDESCGENVHNITSPQGLRDASAIANQMMKDWMGSPEHRKNILSKEYSLIGVGCSTDGEKIFCTQVFSGPNI